MLQNYKFQELTEKIEFLTLLFSKPNNFVKNSFENGNFIEVLKEVFKDYNFSVLENSTKDKDLFEKIKRDWLYLYIGVSGPLATPYASSYYRSTHRLMDKPARDIIKINKRWGIEINDSYKDMPDHLSSILQTISILLEIANEDDREIIVSEVLADTYTLTTDTLTWLRRMKDKTQEHESVKYFSEIVELIIDTLENLKKECELILQ